MKPIRLFLALLLLTVSRLQAADSTNTVSVKIAGASPDAKPADTATAPAPSLFFKGYKTVSGIQTPAATPTSFHTGVYPGIDLITYGDDYQIEYVFVLAAGADPDLLRLAPDGVETVLSTRAGTLIMPIPNGEMVQGKPVAFFVKKDSRENMDADYLVRSPTDIGFRLGKQAGALVKTMNDTAMNIVPAGGQSGGPAYPFYAAKYEVSNEQFLRFLNAMESDTEGKKEKNLTFDKDGNIWICPERERDRDELFSINASRFTYTKSKPAGDRYDHVRTATGAAPAANFPVQGVSWFGAVKYCNWLTVLSGRGAGECCYREGTNALDWAPVPATNWINGVFTDAQRQEWLAMKGFRLPMVNVDTPNVTTNAYGEFYKMAAWNVSTNRTYGFGRDKFDGTDANCRELAGRREAGPLPVGFFNGNTTLGPTKTHRNENPFGIYDLTGNVSEWMTDFARKGSTGERTVCGGSWARSIKPVSISSSERPSHTDNACGFRPATTFMPDERIEIHILFSFYMLGIKPPAPNPPDENIGLILEPAEPGPAEAGRKLSANIYAVQPYGVAYAPRLSTPPPETVPPGTSSGGGSEGSPSAPSVPGVLPRPEPPVYIPTNNLIVNSTPITSVPITVSKTDIYGQNNGITGPFTRTYVTGTTNVVLTAPTNWGWYVFDGWIGTYSTSSNVVSFDMTGDVTETAQYRWPFPPLTATLAFNPTHIAYNDPGSTLTATPGGGNGIYVAYRYQFVLLHHTFYTQWVDSVMSGPINTFDWNYSIKYRVMVQDTTTLWSPWSNEAILIVDAPGIPDPDKTQSGL